ncbi:MAG: PIN domain-containing protein [Nanoarchaeota archaeon]
MKIVIDTNVLIAGLLRDSLVRAILNFSNNLFYFSEYSVNEIIEHKSELIEKTDYSEEEFDEVLNLILSKLNFISDEEIVPFISQAEEVMKEIDIEDYPLIAVALTINADGIWTFDNHFKRQNKIKVFDTNEIFELMK